MGLGRKTIRAKRDLLLRLVGTGVALSVLIIFLKWMISDRNWVVTDNAFVTGNILSINSDATGMVARIFFDETQLVKKGDVLVSLDGQRAQAALAQAEADLARAVRGVGALFSYRRQICEKLISRKAIKDRSLHDLARYKKAASAGATSDQILQNTQDQLVAQEANIQEVRSELQAVDARIMGVTRTNHPDIEAAKARYSDAYLEFLRQNIRAPATGFIAKRRIQVGQRVRPGDQLLNIVPLDHLWVEANLWENRMKYVRPGQEATIKVDLYGSSHIYHGVVEGLVPGSGSVFATLPPDNATGNFIRIVQRVPVRIALNKDEIEKEPLRPGLSTVTSIYVGSPRTSPNASIVKTTSNEYQTEVYDKDLADAQIQGNKIIKQNLVESSVNEDIKCSAED